MLWTTNNQCGAALVAAPAAGTTRIDHIVYWLPVPSLALAAIHTNQKGREMQVSRAIGNVTAPTTPSMGDQNAAGRRALRANLHIGGRCWLQAPTFCETAKKKQSSSSGAGPRKVCEGLGLVRLLVPGTCDEQTSSHTRGNGVSAASRPSRTGPSQSAVSFALSFVQLHDLPVCTKRKIVQIYDIHTPRRVLTAAITGLPCQIAGPGEVIGSEAQENITGDAAAMAMK